MALDDILNNNTALQAFLGKLRFLLYVSVVCSLLAFNLNCQNDLQRIRELVIFTFNYFFNFNILQDHLIEECLSKNLSMLEIIFCYDWVLVLFPKFPLPAVFLVFFYLEFISEKGGQQYLFFYLNVEVRPCQSLMVL